MDSDGYSERGSVMPHTQNHALAFFVNMCYNNCLLLCSAFISAHMHLSSYFSCNLQPF